ncbi:ankyrin repeat and EF-hand domain-containing protein 1a [Carcharodon carcharias]|uniref:ankyrin repeat and EF-hand domain-containing protein 1a n=1 Tax=Carcharodon carcharias TaxID=13397 RepID=UPI001B7DE6D3|nr:ankyrin repeat and EF-hand domain-containing protein 1a [Carcharodon carcharias]
MTDFAEGRLQILQVYKLIQYVRQRDKAEIEKLLTMGVPHLVNLSEPSQGEYALHLAAVANDVETCKLLLSLGAEPNVVDKDGRTAAMIAAEVGHDKTLEVLAEAKADMTMVDKNGKGILYYCIAPTVRHLRCLEIALAHGADVNNCSNDGKPVFLLACEQAAACTEMCLQILEKGADPNSKFELTGHTALMEASREGAIEVVCAILERGCEINVLQNERYNAAHFAAQGGHFEVIRALVAHDCDINVINFDGNTALHLAALGGFADTAKFLAQRGSNPKMKNLQQKTPAAAAKVSGYKAVSKELRKAERLFTKYTKPNVKNPNAPWAIRLYDWSLYHELALRNSFATMDRGDGTLAKEDFAAILMEKNVPMKEEEIAALMTAHDKTRSGVIDINEFFKGTKYLEKVYLMSSYEPKKKKVKKGKRGKKGKLAIPIPICTFPEEYITRREDGGPPEFMIESFKTFTDRNRFSRDNPPEHPLQDDSAWYLDKPEKVYTSINYAARAEDMQSLKRAFFQGVPVDVQDKFFTTPLMAACADGNFTLAKYLVEAKANVNAYDNLRWTPLHHACHTGQQDIVKLLLDAGALINAVSINGATPLMRAVESCRLDCVMYLIDHGAKVDMENIKGQNALDLANAYADIRIIEVVKAKLDSLPKKEKPKKAGKGAKGGSAASSRPQTTAAGSSPGEMVSTQLYPLKSPKRNVPKDSIAKKSEMLNSGVAKKIDITFVPKSVWAHPPTTEELIQRRVENRERFTHEVDFNDFLMPFKKNIKKKLEEPEATASVK